MKEQAAAANIQIQDLEERGYRIVYIDEMCITKSTIPTHAYSPMRKPVEIDLRSFSKTTVAVLAGISKQKGMELVMQFDKSVNTDKFIQYIQKLRFAHPFDQIALFMDRLSVHTCRRSRDQMAFLGFEVILNAVYSPEYNPIETVFSIVKGNIKKQRLRQFMRKEDEDLKSISEKEFNNIKKETCVNLIRHSMNKL